MAIKGDCPIKGGGREGGGGGGGGSKRDDFQRKIAGVPTLLYRIVDWFLM